jgi:glutathione S-transferase
MMTRTLYYTQRSPYARKVRIWLAEKNLPWTLQETDLAHKSPEFLKISPLGKVPVLVDEDATIIWDSTLIVEYLDETYQPAIFYPKDHRQRLQCRQWEELADCFTDNIVALWLQVRKGDKADANDQVKYQTVIDRLFPIIEQQLNKSTYLAGETWNAADIALLSCLGYYNLRFNQYWQKQYPMLNKWFQNLHERDSVQSTIPKA